MCVTVMETVTIVLLYNSSRSYKVKLYFLLLSQCQRAKSIEKELEVKMHNFFYFRYCHSPSLPFGVYYVEVEADNTSFRTKCFLSHYHLQSDLLLILIKHFFIVGFVYPEYYNTQPLIASSLS